MFIEPNSTVKVTVFYKKTGQTYSAYLKKDLKDNKKLSEKEKESLSELNVTMKVLTWDLFNQIQEKSWIPNPEDNTKMTWSNKASKEFKLLNLISDWDAKDKDGNPIKVTKERISALAPEIAEAILDGYEDRNYLTKEEEGK